MDIEEKVLLLALYKKEEDESVNDILVKMENSKVFTFKDGKKMIKKFKSEKLLVDNELTFAAITKAKEVELEFKI